jgi:hypothetical protein
LSGSLEGVCCFDSRNCQTLGVPRQSRGFTLIKLNVAYDPPLIWTLHHRKRFFRLVNWFKEQKKWRQYRGY